jgi:NADH dehydrogenase (ubiquinone) 1 beta subcomplex subunit 3
MVQTQSQQIRRIANDPWAKREAWRKHEMFGKMRQISQMFPGLGIALVAFTGYVLWDNMTAKEDEHHHH